MASNRGLTGKLAIHSSHQGKTARENLPICRHFSWFPRSFQPSVGFCSLVPSFVPSQLFYQNLQELAPFGSNAAQRPFKSGKLRLLALVLERAARGLGLDDGHIPTNDAIVSSGHTSDTGAISPATGALISPNNNLNKQHLLLVQNSNHMHRNLKLGLLPHITEKGLAKKLQTDGGKNPLEIISVSSTPQPQALPDRTQPLLQNFPTFFILPSLPLSSSNARWLPSILELNSIFRMWIELNISRIRYPTFPAKQTLSVLACACYFRCSCFENRHYLKVTSNIMRPIAQVITAA
eukprot:Gb_37617 [translate_table: standard]